MCHSNVVTYGGKVWQIRDIRPEDVTVVQENRNEVYSDIPAGYALLSDGTLLRLFMFSNYTSNNLLGK